MTDDNLAPHVQEIARALANKLDPDTIEDELRRYLEYGVPLAQAKRDIVRNHGGSHRGGVRKLGDLLGGESGVDLVVKVQTVNEKQIQTKDGPKTVWYGFLADDTKSLAYTAWKNVPLERGRSYEMKNVYVKTFREQPDVNIGDFAVVTLAPDVKAVEGFPRAGPAPGPRPAGETLAVKDLRDGLPSVTVRGRVLEAEERQITVQGEPRTIRKGVLADETGRIPFTAWNSAPGLEPGAAVRIVSAYVKAWRGAPELNLGEGASVEPAHDVPPAEALDRARRVDLGELDRAGGGNGVEVEGVVLEVKTGSGLIFRCPECNRMVQKRECRIHGRVEGRPDLRIKAILDDGHAALSLLLGREGTEAILGRSLDECQSLAKEAMSTDVIEDELKAKLVGRRLVAVGNALKDEYGLALIAGSARLPGPRDAKAEAEALLEDLASKGVTA